jgi:hypothetical protein
MTKHHWVCVKAGMFVSLFECKNCKQETRDPHDEETCDKGEDSA